MADDLPLADDHVSFSNSQGLEGRGTLMNLTRQAVVFEVYNPYSIVQLSEVLNDLRIRRGRRVLYQGRAVVSNLVNTGLMLIVSATLVDVWAEPEGLAPGEGLRGELEAFLREWTLTDQSLHPDYRLLVSSIRGFLENLNQWLSQGESLAGVNNPQAKEALAEEFTADTERAVLPRLQDLFGSFEQVASRIDPRQVALHKAWIRRELHPLMLCSPFIHRTFTKPLGYAGDFEMVNMMVVRPRWEGRSTYARIINSILIASDGAAAHRNRIDRLVGYLTAEAARVRALGRPLRVLNVACGPAIEVQRFVRDSELADGCILHLLDFNDVTIAHARERIAAAASEGGRRTTVEFIHKSIHDLLQEARGRSDTAPPSYDLVYCAGLFDYLSDRICARLVELFARWTVPGGLVVATNVDPSNPVRYFMEHIVEWTLVYRDAAQMITLRPAVGESVVTSDGTGVNVFLETRLSAGG